jgi:hypothetical protein
LELLKYLKNKKHSSFGVEISATKSVTSLEFTCTDVISELKDAYQTFNENPPEKRLWHTWKDNIKTDFRKTGCEGVERIQNTRIGSTCSFL